MPTGIFSTYRQGENRVTSSILAVLRSITLDRSETLLRRFLGGDDEFALLTFKNQPGKGGKGTPDAEIASSVRILIETKTRPHAVSAEQLTRHLERLKDSAHETCRLLVLTPDAHPPTEIDQMSDSRIAWASFDTFAEAIDTLLDDPKEAISEREAFLLRELQGLFEEDGLTGGPLDTLVVPARRAWGIYLRDHACVRQTERSFRRMQYIAFYAGNAIMPRVPMIEEVRDGLMLEEGKYKGRWDDVVAGHIRRFPQDRGGVRQVFLLTAPDDPRTRRLPAPHPQRFEVAQRTAHGVHAKSKIRQLQSTHFGQGYFGTGLNL